MSWIFLLGCLIIVALIWFFLFRKKVLPKMTVGADTMIEIQSDYHSMNLKRVELTCDTYRSEEELAKELESILAPLTSKILVFNNEEALSKTKKKESLVLPHNFQTGIVNYLLNNLKFPDKKEFSFRFFFDKEDFTEHLK